MYTKSQLTKILSALCGESRRPSGSEQALKAIEKKAHEFNLTTDELFETAVPFVAGEIDETKFMRLVRNEPDLEMIKKEKAKTPRGAPRSHRENTKETMVIDMLRRETGATVAEIMEATGWKAHTVRGFFAGALKKRRGLIITSEKPVKGGQRSYRLP